MYGLFTITHVKSLDDEAIGLDLEARDVTAATKLVAFDEDMFTSCEAQAVA